jgi:hypothetical protein
MTDVTPEYAEACRSYLEQVRLVYTYSHLINQAGRLYGLKTRHSQARVFRPISKARRTPRPSFHINGCCRTQGPIGKTTATQLSPYAHSAGKCRRHRC